MVLGYTSICSSRCRSSCSSVCPAIQTGICGGGEQNNRPATSKPGGATRKAPAAGDPLIGMSSWKEVRTGARDWRSTLTACGWYHDEANDGIGLEVWKHRSAPGGELNVTPRGVITYMEVPATGWGDTRPGCAIQGQEADRLGLLVATTIRVRRSAGASGNSWCAGAHILRFRQGTLSSGELPPER